MYTTWWLKHHSPSKLDNFEFCGLMGLKRGGSGARWASLQSCSIWVSKLVKRAGPYSSLVFREIVKWWAPLEGWVNPSWVSNSISISPSRGWQQPPLSWNGVNTSLEKLPSIVSAIKTPPVLSSSFSAPIYSSSSKTFPFPLPSLERSTTLSHFERSKIRQPFSSRQMEPYWSCYRFVLLCLIGLPAMVIFLSFHGRGILERQSSKEEKWVDLVPTKVFDCQIPLFPWRLILWSPPK